MKKRILYIILGVMLSFQGWGQTITFAPTGATTFCYGNSLTQLRVSTSVTKWFQLQYAPLGTTTWQDLGAPKQIFFGTQYDFPPYITSSQSYRIIYSSNSSMSSPTTVNITIDLVVNPLPIIDQISSSLILNNVTGYYEITYGNTATVSSSASSPSLSNTWTFSSILNINGSSNTNSININAIHVGGSTNLAFEDNLGCSNSIDIDVTTKPITITPTVGQSKVYGDVDPTYTYTNSEWADNTNLTGALSRVAGENVNTYAYTLGDLSAGTNYTLSIVGSPSTFAITAKPLTVTPTAGQSKVYGSANPVYDYSLSETVPVTGALSRVAGENVNTYAYTLGDLSAGTNYSLSIVGSPSTFAITAKALSITAVSIASRVYDGTKTVGAITIGSLTGFIGTESVTATAAGTDYASANVGSYASTISYTLVDGTNGGKASNYSLISEIANGTITPKLITVSALANQTKIYGDADPVYTYSTNPSIIGLAPLVGTLTRVAGENVASYAILIGTLANANYTISYVGANFAITPKPITINANAGQSKIYGSADPLVYSYTPSPSIAGLASLVGKLSRVAGENAGNYVIQQNTLTTINNPNYTISFVGANFTITPKQITVTANAGQTKIYGDADPTSFAYTLSAPLVGNDVISGALTRVAGESVGSYAISQGTLTNTNYIITYVGSNFTITQKRLTITATSEQTKVYGVADPTSFSYTLSAPLVGSDVLTGALTRAAGEIVGSYAINQGTLTNANYDITYLGNNFRITQKPITITVDAGQTKVYGASNPLTYSYGVSPSLTGLVALNGTLTRASGETVGTYTIQQNDLTTANNPNYSISYVGANFTITPKPITITVNQGQSKYYGDPEPAIFTYTTSPSISGLVALVGTLLRSPGEIVGSYSILQNDLTTVNNPNYIITFVSDNFIINPAAPFFQIPNAFVPGSQNEYDNIFRIFANSSFPPSLLISFRIFNRAGQLIKTFTGINDSWDGKGPDGSLLESDVYIWVATFVDDPLTKKIPRSGTFVLLK